MVINKQQVIGYTDYVIEEGSEVTIELLPDYGYQYVAGGINGNPTTPDEGKATYTFIMPNNNIHLSAIFEKTSDVLNINSDYIKNASIIVPANEINGNAEFNVNEIDIEDEKEYEEVARRQYNWNIFRFIIK